MADELPVLLTLDEAVAVLTLNSPERLNALSAAGATSLLEMLCQLRERDDVRAIVLTGAGRAFCAGAYLGQGGRTVSRAERKAPVGHHAAVTRAIVDVDKPVISAIGGVAVGAGLAYALATDRRFADRTARFSAIFVKRGLHPDCGVTYFLPRIVGLPAALHMVCTGAMLDAETALRIGLVDELVDEGGALPAALAYAKELARGPSVAIELARRGIYKSLAAGLDEMLDYEGFAAGIAGQTNDQKEGIRAFLEKRPPAFTGT